MKRRIISVITILCIVMSFYPIVSKANGTANDLLNVAYNECDLSIGYKQQEFNGCTKYGEWLGVASMDWCAAFVAWCANQAGISSSVVPHYSYVNDMISFYSNRGLYKASSSYTPKLGDLAFLTDFQHVAIVISATSTSVTTIEGNTSKSDFTGNSLYVSIKTRGISYFKGFATPAYTTETSAPTNCTISANYTSIGVGDTVTFNYNISGASGYKGIGIDYAGGSRYTSFAVNSDNGEATYTFTEAGTYCCIIEGSNSLGYNCSSGVYITVLNSKPTNMSISSNRTEIDVGDTITFDYSITGATVKHIGLDYGGKRYDSVRVYPDSSSVSYTFTKAGTYCCIIEGYNNIGYDCSPGIYITVNPKPITARISADYSSIGVGDTVTFNYNIDNATSYKGLGIDYAGGSRYHSQPLENSSGAVTHTFNESGFYCCIVEGYNTDVYNCSSGVYVRVIDTAPIDMNISADKTNILIGDTVTFDYSIIGATVKHIGLDYGGERYDSVRVYSDSDRVSYTFTKAGTYCCIIEGYNNIGYNCSNGIYITVNENYIVSYDANGGINEPIEQAIDSNGYCTLSETIPTRKGYTFVGWSENSKATVADYFPNENAMFDRNVTLYAVWVALPSITVDVEKYSKMYLIKTNVSNLNEDATVILATYKNGNLVNLQNDTFTGEVLAFTENIDFDEIKIVVWDSLNEMKPLCSAVSWHDKE